MIDNTDQCSSNWDWLGSET